MLFELHLDHWWDNLKSKACLLDLVEGNQDHKSVGVVLVEAVMVAALVRHLQVTLQGCRQCVPTMDRDSSCCKFPRRGWCKKNSCEVQKESLRGACS